MNYRIGTIFIYLNLLIFSPGFSQQRPKVGLVLSGGGAKGLAHIGVIKVIEELGIEVDYIGGASMGSIIGGLYATGYSADSIREIAKNLNWISFFTDEVDRKNLSILNKVEQDRYIVSFPAKKFKPKLPSGLSAGQTFSEIYSDLVWPYLTVNDFSKLPIPFLCIATNFEDGNPVTLDHGYLPDAVRASMSIPSLFAPVCIDSMYLIDGGVSDNFPVEALQAKDIDIIIGVSLGAQTDAPYMPGSVGSILYQTTFVKSRNVKEKNEALCNILIIPNFTGFGAMSFNNADSLIALGERAARKQINELKALADNLKQFSRIDTEKAPTQNTYTINKIRFEGCEKTSEILLARLLNLNIPGTYDKGMLTSAIQRAYGSQLFTKVAYRIESENEENILFVNVTEKPPQLFQFGVHYNSVFKAGMLLNFTQRYRIGKKSLRFSVDAIISAYQRYKVENLIFTSWSSKTGNRKSKFSIIPNLGISYSYQTYDPYIYDSIGDITSNFHYIQSSPRVFLFYEINKNFNLYIGSEYQYASQGPNLVNSPVDKSTSNTLKFDISLIFDSFDDKWYPKSGIKLNAGINYGSVLEYEDNQDPDFYRYYFYYNQAIKIVPKFSIIPRIYTASVQGNDVPWDNQLFYGGINNTQINLSAVQFVGYDFMEIQTKNLIVFRSDFQWNIYGDHYLIAKLNIGDTADRYEQLLGEGDIIMGAGLSYVYKSLAGPVELTLMQANNRQLKAHICLGFWF